MTESDLCGLADLLLDAIDSGAAVSFLSTLTQDAALTWCQEVISQAPPRAVFLMARDAMGIVGSVELQPAWAPNQPHRAEIVKLLVHRRVRRAGLGTRLMGAID